MTPAPIQFKVPEIDTGRLLLRTPQAEDYAVYRDFFADAEASHFYGGPFSPEQAWRLLATDMGHWLLRGYGRWSVVEKCSGRMVGGCGLWWPEGYPRRELTWWIVPSARRNGYALEASRAVIRFGYRTLGLDLVETHTKDTNLAAQALIQKLGGTVFAREAFPDGHTRNVYALPDL